MSEKLRAEEIFAAPVASAAGIEPSTDDFRNGLAGARDFAAAVHQGSTDALGFIRKSGTYNHDWLAVTATFLEFDRNGWGFEPIWPAFDHLVDREIGAGTGGDEGLSGYLAFVMSCHLALRGVFERRSLPRHSILMRGFVRRQLALLSLFSSLGPDGRLRVTPPARRAHHFHEGLAMCVADLAGVSPPQMKPNWREESWRRAMVIELSRQFGACRQLFSPTEREAMLDWILRRTFDPEAWREILSGCRLLTQLEVSIGQRGGLDAYAPQMRECDDPLPAVSIEYGRPVRCLRWAGYPESGKGDGAWFDADKPIQTRMTGQGFEASWSGRIGVLVAGGGGGAHYSGGATQIRGHGQSVAATITISTLGVRVQGMNEEQKRTTPPASVNDAALAAERQSAVSTPPATEATPGAQPPNTESPRPDPATQLEIAAKLWRSTDRGQKAQAISIVTEAMTRMKNRLGTQS